MRVTALQWGVKQSFRSYVEMSGGTINTAGGAGRAADGTFTFAAATDSDLAVDAGAVSGTGRFEGEVSFSAHGGMLSVTLVDPGVETAPDGLVLTAAETPARARRITIAKLGGLTAEGALPATITLDGMLLIGDHYPPGTELDPVRLA